jgi:hypothetical protein
VVAVKRITGEEFGDALIAAGIITADEGVRRVVIDAQVGYAVVVYIERLGDERLLSVAQTLEGVEIKGIPA